MSQNNVYGSIPSVEEVDKKVYANGNSSYENTGNSATSSKEASDATPNAQDTTGLNVTTDAQTKAKKFEFKNLQGELELTPTLKNFSIVRGSTIHLTGVGKYLSGFYFVTARTVSVSNGGALTIKLKVVKTKFGDSLKGEKPLPEVKTIDTMGSADGESVDDGSSSSSSYSDSSYSDFEAGESSPTYSDGTPVGGGNSGDDEERIDVSY